MIVAAVIRLKLPPSAGVDNADLLRMLLLRSQQTTAQHAYTRLWRSASVLSAVKWISSSFDSLRMDKCQMSDSCRIL